MKTPYVRAAAMVLTVLLFSGCTQIKQKLLVTPEGAGSFEISIKLNQELVKLASAAEIDEDTPYEVPAADVKTLLKMEPKELEKLMDMDFMSAFESDVYYADYRYDKSKNTFTYKVFFEDVGDLTGHELGGEAVPVQQAHYPLDGVEFSSLEDETYSVSLNSDGLDELPDISDKDEYAQTDISEKKRLLKLAGNVSYTFEISGLTRLVSTSGFKNDSGKGVLALDVAKLLSDVQYNAEIRKLMELDEINVVFAKPSESDLAKIQEFKKKLANVKAECEKKYEILQKKYYGEDEELDE